MKQTLVRQLMLMLALVCYLGQASASVGIFHGGTGERMQHGSVESQTIHAPGGLAHQHNGQHEQIEPGLQDHHAIQAAAAEDCCSQHSDCGAGHCSASIAVSGATWNIFASLQQDSVYVESSTNAPSLSHFKPPILL